MKITVQQIPVKKNSYNKFKMRSIFKILVSCDIKCNFLFVLKDYVLQPNRKFFLLQEYLYLKFSLNHTEISVIVVTEYFHCTGGQLTVLVLSVYS